jgi:hypothetical protein
MKNRVYDYATTTLYMITSPSIFYEKNARLPQKKIAWEKTAPTQKTLTTQHFQKMGRLRKNENA